MNMCKRKEQQEGTFENDTNQNIDSLNICFVFKMKM